MPQLMPLFWNFSFIMVFMLMMFFIIFYSNIIYIVNKMLCLKMNMKNMVWLW